MTNLVEDQVNEIPVSNCCSSGFENILSIYFELQSTDHAARIARFALDAMQAAYETPIDMDDPSRGTVHIRVSAIDFIRFSIMNHAFMLVCFRLGSILVQW